MYNLLELAMWGRKSKAYKQLSGRTHSGYYGKSGQPKPVRVRYVLDERAMTHLTGKLLTELDRDLAISVINEIKKMAR
jgi:hypothetical protein